MASDPSLAKMTARVQSARNQIWLRSFADAIEARRIVPQDLSSGRLGQVGIFGEISHGVLGKLLCGVGMRIVSGHDEVIVADVLDEGAD